MTGVLVGTALFKYIHRCFSVIRILSAHSRMTAMVARRQPLPTFTGGEELLDQLIAASSAHKMTSSSTTPVRVRELKPYFAPDADVTRNPVR